MEEIILQGGIQRSYPHPSRMIVFWKTKYERGPDVKTSERARLRCYF